MSGLEVQVAELRAEFGAMIKNQGDMLERLTAAVETQSETLGSLKENLHRTDLMEERLGDTEDRVAVNTAFRERVTGAGMVLGSGAVVGVIVAILRLLLIAKP